MSRPARCIHVIRLGLGLAAVLHLAPLPAQQAWEVPGAESGAPPHGGALSVRELEERLAMPQAGLSSDTGLGKTRSFRFKGGAAAPDPFDGACPKAGQKAPVANRSLVVVPYANDAPSVDLELNFANDSDALTEPGVAAQLAILAEALKGERLGQQRFVIAGHANRTGSAPYNLAGSCSRALVVRNYLIARGVAPERLSAYGFGYTRPLPGTDPAAARNRRIEIRAAP